MKTNFKSTSNSSLHKGRSKDTYFHGQMKSVFKAFSSKPKTMLMVSVETGILRANICRYIAKWKKQNSIILFKKGICPISKHRAGFYTTNPNYFKETTNRK